MDDLIAKLEAATGPNLQLEWLIAGAPRFEDGTENYNVPRYTCSLDAARTFVPEGWRWQLFELNSGKWDARLIRRCDSECVTAMYAQTAELALCLAAARAWKMDAKVD